MGLRSYLTGVEPSFYNISLPLSAWGEICNCLRRRAWDLLNQSAEFGRDSPYGSILYNEHLAVTAIADELEAILPPPEDA